MVLLEIYDIFEKRKRNIEKILNNGHSLSLEKQHEMEGAMNEIEMFLKTLKYYSAQQRSRDEINLMSNGKSPAQQHLSLLGKKRE